MFETSTTNQKNLWGIAPAISNLAKRNVLRSKVQVPRWTPFCYVIMNKHKNCKLSIYAAGSIHVLQMYVEFIEKGHKQVAKNFIEIRKVWGWQW